MTKRRPAAEDISVIRDELTSFLQAYDPDDAEDVQVRTSALISSMIRAGVLKESRMVKNFRLDIAIGKVQLPLRNRDAILSRAEMFHDLISSYDGEPDEEDMETARTLLEEIAAALNLAIDVKMKKGQARLRLLNRIEGKTE